MTLEVPDNWRHFLNTALLRGDMAPSWLGKALLEVRSKHLGLRRSYLLNIKPSISGRCHTFPHPSNLTVGSDRHVTETAKFLQGDL